MAKAKKPDPNADLKEQYIKFYRDCPIQKRAAQSIRKDEDTIIRWKHADPSFADDIKQAESDFIRARLLRTNADWQLERLFNAEFKAPKNQTELSGELKVTPILGGNSVKEDDQTINKTEAQPSSQGE